MALPDYGPRNPPAPTDPTKPPPPPLYAKGPGKWYGNQWMDDAVAPPVDPNALPEGGYKPAEAPVTAAPPPPNTAATTTAPADVYRETITSLLNTPAAPDAPAAEGPHMKFVRSKNGGFVPFNHPDADPNSPEVDPATGQPVSGGAGTGDSTFKGDTIEPTDTTATPKSLQELYLQKVMDLLNGPSAEEAAANVNNSPAVAAFRNEQMRRADLAQARTAEQSGLTGLQGSGGFEGQVEALRQAAGENTATYAGDQANTLMANRRAEIAQMLQFAQSAGQFEQTQALQRELAQLDATLRNRGFDIEETLGHESNANQRYNTEIQKMLGMDDTALRKYLGEMQNTTNRYGIDVTANTNADRLGLDWTDMMNKYLLEQDKLRLSGGK